MSEDQDIDIMHQIVDTHHDSVDEELEALLKNVRSRLVKNHIQYYSPIISNLERKIEEQKLQNTILDKGSESIAAETERIDYLIERFVDHISIMKTKDRVFNQRSKIFHAWRDLSITKKIREEAMNRLYLEEPMKRILFKRWVRKMRRVRLQRQKRELRRSCTRDIRAQETEAAQRIYSLKSELVAVKELLAEHERQHGEMQQKLRRAFMRGVVNLNLEAVDVFGEVSPGEVFSTASMPTFSPKGSKAPVTEPSDEDEDSDEFSIEPAPRISVIRHSNN